ncbi:hypothetical protein Hanom_Chr14g01281501 [Helianthus anomalus]
MIQTLPNNITKSLNQQLTRSLTANMTKKSSNLLHLSSLIASCPKSKRLVQRGRGNKRFIIPEPDRVRHRSVSFSEKLLKLIRIKVVGNRKVTAILRPPFTFPTLVTHFLPLHFLHQYLRRRISVRY